MPNGRKTMDWAENGDFYTIFHLVKNAILSVVFKKTAKIPPILVLL